MNLGDKQASLELPRGGAIGATAKMPKLAKRKSSFMVESIVKRISREDIRLVYTIEKVLGSGNFGTARLAHKTGNQLKKYAIKSI